MGTLTPTEGDYEGDVMAAWTELDFYDKDLMVCFDISLLEDGNGEVVTARHFTTGEYAKITEKIFTEILKLPWPATLRDMAPCAGARVRVRVKHKDGKHVNAYIITAKERKPASPEQVETVIAKLEAEKKSADKDEFPF